MEPEYKLGEILTLLKIDLLDLGATKLELLKLQTFEKSSRLGSLILWGFIVINLIFFASLFAFIALGFLFSDWVGDHAGGFGLVVLLYLVILGILLVFRKGICTWIQNKLLTELDPNLAKETEK
ncbi:MAG: phage holin family protein [Candidatus Symbiothrix sp.]|jgi:hypothetical protein|nr:phage holin family protein [Candidatus Symbiothrix sp.]